jgi:hypothetical protein
LQRSSTGQTACEGEQQEKPGDESDCKGSGHACKGETGNLSPVWFRVLRLSYNESWISATVGLIIQIR